MASVVLDVKITLYKAKGAPSTSAQIDRACSMIAWRA
jgi:hypothetical protein